MKVTIADRFKAAGRELLKLNVGNVVKSFGLPDYDLLNQQYFLGSSSYKPNDLQHDNPLFAMAINGSSAPFWNKRSSLTAFQLCPPVSAILMQKAQAFINGQTFVMGKDGKESNSEVANRIRKVMTQPNPYQSWDHFEMQVYVNTMVFGFTIILPMKPVGFDGSYATQLWAIPGSMIEIELNEETALFKPGAKPFKSITVIYGQERTPLLQDDIFIMKDSTPSFMTMALPESRINLLQKPIMNIIGALESRGVLITNRGPRYVVSNAASDTYGTKMMTPEEKDDAELNFKYSYGLLRGQSQAIVTSATLNISAIGYDVKQLGLMEEVQESSSMACQGLGFPKFLAGLSDPTFNNQDTAEKALYQRFLIPEAKSFYGQLNTLFNTAGHGLRIEKDYSQIPVLQEDKTNLGRARYFMNQACEIEWLNNIITANEWRIANGYDTIAGWDIYYSDWVALGKTFGKGAGGVNAPQQTVVDNPNAGAPQ